MPETKVVQIFFRRHFVTKPTENVLQCRCVNIQHNFNMYESMFKKKISSSSELLSNNSLFGGQL